MLRRITAHVLLIVAATSAVHAQDFVPGRLVERMTSSSNPSQAYALYVPSAYTAAKAWPILFIMDPSGRALAPMRQFIPAAEKYGYIAISSYNTVSDGPVQPNLVAINAMIADARAMLKIDTRRFYMVGFSGTARNAWDFASELNGPVAGIFGAGASGMTLGVDSVAIRPGLAWFGTAGVYDFNYEEVRAYEAQLRRTGLPHRVRFFIGTHQWPPDSLATQGVEYFQLRAMKLGFIALDTSFVAHMYDADTTRARVAERASQMEDAINRWREIDREYAAMRPSAAPVAVAEVERLESDARLLRELDRKRGFADAYLENRQRVAAWFVKSEQTPGPVDVAWAIKDLRIMALRKSAAKTGDRDAADAAQRQINDLYAQFSFYHPREALRAGDKQRALAYLDIADAAKPGATRNLMLRAEASR